MFDFDLPGQVCASNGLMKQLHGVCRFAAPFDNTIHAEFFVSVGLNNLPAAGTANYDLELLTVRTGFDFLKHQTRIMRIDWLFRGAENRSVDACSKGYA